ncbi:hypothetical protein QE109_13975 [Fusibacter bizertensis]|uniref:Uncharacterized protein n=1 Tax=Fusibacter bizertensis TaxID=1488331 RepID=A0ABT6NFS0_9FIRM|nr:hypothetical protein [Fusibacter bizertensis]MDH8679261.1 hypothetical protein [Fusibacter bizertensis]
MSNYKITTNSVITTGNHNTVNVNYGNEFNWLEIEEALFTLLMDLPKEAEETKIVKAAHKMVIRDEKQELSTFIKKHAGVFGSSLITSCASGFLVDFFTKMMRV